MGGSTRARLLVSAGVLCAAVVSACGGSSGGTTSESGQNAATTAPDPAAVATQAVNEYYGDIDSEEFGQAWQLLGPQQRHEDQGFQTWKGGYTSTARTAVVRMSPTVVDPQTVQVAVTVKTLDEYACDNRVRRTYGGT